MGTMMNHGKFVFIALCMSGGATSALSETSKHRPPPPELYSRLTACRGISADAERLACFDAALTKLDAAIASDEVYMADKAQIRETRKTLFGLPLPNLGIFGNGDDDNKDANQVSQIDSAVKSASVGADGFIVTLADGSTWRQVDGTPLGRSPKPGMAVTVKKAALGSFKMNVAGQSAVRVKRIF